MYGTESTQKLGQFALPGDCDLNGDSIDDLVIDPRNLTDLDGATTGF